MRSISRLTFLTIGALCIHALGCASEEPATSTGGPGGPGGAGGAGGGAGGAGGEGGAECVPEAEICDTFDNDCDMEVDEGCACFEGDTQGCYTGPRGTQGVGACVMGTQTCDPATNTYGPCEGEVTPAAADACDGTDDDCDGEIDEGIPDLACGVGACAAVVPGCVGGTVNQCVPGMPSVEVCDAVDNDCDQLTDETFPNMGSACDSGIPGVCAAGTTQCMAGAQVCVASAMPVIETCDGLDNDCNGVVDDAPGTGGACTTGSPGVCADGTISCSGGTIDCVANTPASPELCDGLDNDCNGQTDEGNPQGGGACDTGQPGVCQAGTLNCISAGLQCIPNAVGSAETCDGLDNNCDGQIDENNPGGGTACGCGGTNSCISGQLVCQGGPTTYFSEDFSDNSAGWTLGTTWQIGPAMSSTGGVGNGDPAMDHTSTSDNGVAGVVIGGNAPTALHPYYYLTSPPFNTNVAGPVIFEYWRWLNSDYTPYMQNDIEVWNGTSWVVVFQTGGTGTFDSSWQKYTYDLTAYKNANMQIRFGYLIGSSGVYTISSWNIDDVLVASASCP